MTEITRNALHPEARRELEAIYREVDRAVDRSGVACHLRGRCCDFETSEHRLYASSVELAYVREAHPLPFPAGSVLCPFWRDGLCVERERRPLGCRTYFCDERHREAMEALHEASHRQISGIADRHGMSYRYTPFVDALRSRTDD